MSISSSLNASVMGLNANATRLSTISDNIANSETYGYKRSQAAFSSLVLQQPSSTYSAGGVQVNTSKDVGALGALISTGNSTDLAVAGRGMLPVTDLAGVNATGTDRSVSLVPTGSFLPDEDGNLRTQTGQFLLGWPTDAEGDVGTVSRNSATNLEPVNIAAAQYVAEPTTRVDVGINLPADATLAGADPTPYTLPVEYFDNLGRPHTLTLSFAGNVPPTGTTNNWTVDVFDSAGDPALSLGQMDITFDDAIANAGRIDTASGSGGVSYSDTTGIATITLPHGDVEVYVGGPGLTGGLTQFAASFSPTNVSKNGSSIGDLQAVEVDEQGFLQAIYDNGFRRSLYQIPVGDVPNLNGLRAQDSQAFKTSSDSGDLYLWDAGSGPVGAMSGFSLMESTTDIASELTDLIETQRAYSSNAKIVQTVDEMLQETTNLKR